MRDYDIEILEELDSVETSINWLQKNESPDVIFLDIQLSDGLCFKIFEKVKVSSKIIFITSHSEFSIKAFDYYSISYLLKPINKRKLNDAILKVQSIQKKENDFKKLRKLLKNNELKDYKTSFVVKMGNNIKIINSEEVICFFSFQNATYLKTTKSNYLINDSLTGLESNVNPNRFFRVSRTFIINRTAIEDISIYKSSRLKLKLDISLEKDIIVSREKVSSFRNWIAENNP